MKTYCTGLLTKKRGRLIGCPRWGECATFVNSVAPYKKIGSKCVDISSITLDNVATCSYFKQIDLQQKQLIMKDVINNAISALEQQGKRVTVITALKAARVAVNEDNKRIYSTVKKEQAEKQRILEEKNQPEVASIYIAIEWVRSSTWGSNPHATATVEYKDGGIDTFSARCSGWGYDKQSTVVAELLNKVLKYKLWQLNSKPPYGVAIRPNNRYFEGGVGMSCYTGSNPENSVIAAIGGIIKCVANSKRFDAWQITF